MNDNKIHLNIIEQPRILKSAEDINPDLKLSVSKAKTFSSCKAKFKYSYIQKLPKKEWEHFTLGSFAHEILELFHKDLLKNQDQMFHHVMSKSYKEAYLNWKDKLNIDITNEVKQMMHNYLVLLEKQKKEKTLPNVIAVEDNFYIDIGNNILLNGFIDRTQIDYDNVIHVADYKTTKNKKYLKNDFFQLLTYAFALMLKDKNLQKVRASYICLRHNFDYITEEFTREEAFSVQKEYLQYANDIANEKLWRTSPQFLCKYCDYVDICEDGRNFLVKRGIIKKEKTMGINNWD